MKYLCQNKLTIPVLTDIYVEQKNTRYFVIFTWQYHKAEKRHPSNESSSKQHHLKPKVKLVLWNIKAIKVRPLNRYEATHSAIWGFNTKALTFQKGHFCEQFKNCLISLFNFVDLLIEMRPPFTAYKKLSKIRDHVCNKLNTNLILRCQPVFLTLNFSNFLSNS